MLLADSAQVSEGKLFVLGGGWSRIGPGPTPSAVAIIIEVPWDQTNVTHRWRLELVDSDGRPVMWTPTPEGEQPLVIQGQFEVGRPPGIALGSSIGMPLAINFGPLPLGPGSRYEWRLTVDNESDSDWRLPFSTRPGVN